MLFQFKKEKKGEYQAKTAAIILFIWLFPAFMLW